jgi:hypothetical protein
MGDLHSGAAADTASHGSRFASQSDDSRTATNENATRIRGGGSGLRAHEQVLLPHHAAGLTWPLSGVAPDELS